MTPDTQLRTLTRCELRLECPACHHGATVRVSDLIKQLGSATTLGTFQSRIRCRSCGEANPIIVIPAHAPSGVDQDIAERESG